MVRIAPLLPICLIAACPAIAQTDPVESSPGEPFDRSARWSHYLHRTFGPSRLGLLAAETAIDHARREPVCWDHSAGSYAQRYARAFDRRLIRNSTEFAAGMLTGEDLRYKRSRSRSMGLRVWNAMRSSVTAKMPDGSRRPAYTRFFASVAADVSTAHWTGQPVRMQWALQSLGWSILDQAQTNLMDEFEADMRRMAGRLWRVCRHSGN